MLQNLLTFASRHARIGPLAYVLRWGEGDVAGMVMIMLRKTGYGMIPVCGAVSSASIDNPSVVARLKMKKLPPQEGLCQYSPISHPPTKLNSGLCSPPWRLPARAASR